MLPPDPDALRAAALGTLERVFGYHSFVGLQGPVVEHVLAGGDAVVLMPTGGGKSVCYQLPSLVRPGMGLVVSPLIALMQDQVASLRQMGVQAASLTSAQPAEEARQTMEDLRAGRLELLYVAPERLMQPWFQDQLQRIPLACIAIDEAHCVSQWGHNFRPEYLQLACLKQLFPGVPRLALTATADAPTRQDILTRLELDAATVFVASFDRPNITYFVSLRDHAERTLIERIRTRYRGQSGIVYRMSRKKVEDTARKLNEADIPALAYHAGMPAGERARAQERFMREDGVVMVATVAFGMGVDKPDVRFVAHLDPPMSLEAYHQETGRAGRDGQPAEAWMVYGLEDMVRLGQMLDNDSPPEGIPPEQHERFRRIQHAKLSALFGFCETTGCRRQALLRYFGENLPEPCGACDTCLHPPQTMDATVPAQKALSCVFRAGGRGGAGLLVDVLTGVASKAVQAWGFQELSTFGIGEELSKAQWTSLYRQLLAAGYLRATHSERGFTNLQLTDSSWDILKGRTSFAMRCDEARAARRGRSRTERLAAAASPEAEALFEALRARRRQFADAQDVPAYIIFPDITLWEMVALLPKTEAEFAAVRGVGANKAARYAQAFLEIIREHQGQGGPPAKGLSPAPVSPLLRPLEGVPGAKELFGGLDRLREAITGKYGEDPGSLWSEETLVELALHRPRTLAGLALVKGIRPLAALLHGPAVLEAIAEFDGRQGRPVDVQSLEEAFPDRVSKLQAEALPVSAVASLEQFRQLGEAEAVAEARGLAVSTVYAHLLLAVMAGELPVEAAAGVSPAQWTALEGRFKEIAAKGFWRHAPYLQGYQAVLGEGTRKERLYFIHNALQHIAWRKAQDESRNQ
ncbi:DNA helicase RecQ [Megalodesulfovibrio paquesii]